jgi:exopolysaccharide biosynthesis polyprenyl glycosylphosphotransferase
MTKLFGHSIRSELLLLYVIETLVCFLAIYAVLSSNLVRSNAIGHGTALALAATLALCAGLVSGASGLYQPHAWRRASRFAAGALVGTVVLLAVTQGLLLLTTADAPSILGEFQLTDISLMAGAFIAAIAATHLGFAALARSGALKRRVAVLRTGDAQLAVEREIAAASAPFVGFEVAVAVPLTDTFHPDLAPAQLRAMRIWAVIAPDPASVPATMRAGFARAGLKLLSETEFVEQRSNRMDVDRLPQDWLANAPGLQPRRLDAALRRLLDIVGSLVLLVATLPLTVIAAIAIKLDTPGPVFYRQQRVGLNGRVFTLFKFRSMVADAEAAGPRWASKRDNRVTRVGKFLRLTRIDEIPQAINVLRGDMALVGPRPERPGFVESLGRSIPRYHDRAVVKPGITGWAQVNYPYGASVDDARMKLAYDLYYVQRRSLFLDLLILVATVRVVLFQEGSR